MPSQSLQQTKPTVTSPASAGAAPAAFAAEAGERKRERTVLRAIVIIGLALCVPVCVSAQEPKMILNLVPPVEVKEFVWDGGGTGGALVDAVGEVCRFRFRKSELSQLEYVSASGARKERIDEGDPRSAAMIKLLLNWVDERFSAEQQSALSAEPRDAHLSAYESAVRKVATTPGQRAVLADSTSPCGAVAAGDSIEIWVDWPETVEDVAWFILSKFRVTSEVR